MPPESQNINRIGLGVDVDDPGQATLAYLREVDTRLTRIASLGRQVGSIRTPRVQDTARAAQDSANANIRAIRAQQEIQRQLVQSIDQSTRAIHGNIIRGEASRTEVVRNQARARTEAQRREYERDAANYERSVRRKDNVRRYRAGDIIFTTPEGQATAQALYQARVTQDAEDKLRAERHRKAVAARAEEFRQMEAETERRARRQAQFEDPAYRTRMRERLRAGQPDQLEAGLNDLQSRRRQGRDRLEQLQRDELAQEIRERRVQDRQRRARQEQERVAQEQARVAREAEAAVDRAAQRSQRRQARVEDPARQARIEEGRRFIREQQHVAQYGPLQRELDQTTSKATQLNSELRRTSMRGPAAAVRGEARAIHAEMAALGRRAIQLREEINTPASLRRTEAQVRADARNISQAFSQLEARAKRLKFEITSNPPGTRGGQDGDGQQGLSPVARITRNFLLYRALSLATFGLGQYTREALAAARASDDVERALSNEAVAAQTSAQANLRLAESIRLQTGLARGQARQLVTEGLRFAEEEPYLAERLTQAVSDIGAARGARPKEIPELMEQLRRRESKFYKRFVGRTVEDIYERYATEKVDEGGLYSQNIEDFSGKFKTRDAAIREYVGLMSDAEKAQAVYNAVLEKSAVFAGQSAVRHESLSGRLDRLNSRWTDAQEGMGLTLLQVRPLIRGIEILADALERLDWSKFQGSGPGGVPQAEQLEDFIRQRTDSWTAAISRWAEGTPLAQGLDSTVEASLQERIGRIILSATRLERIIPGAGGYVGEGEREREGFTEEFFAMRRERIMQQAREGSLRYRRPGEEYGISVEERRQMQIEGQDTSVFSEQYVESDQQRLQRQRRDYERNQADAQRKHAARAESDRLEAEHDRLKRQAQEDLNQQAQALAKIREATEGSFRIVEEVAQQRTVDNPFVKLFTDGATAAQRMRLQFGYLGDETVDYFTKLEQGRIRVQVFVEQYGALQRATEFFNKAQREQAEYNLSPELTREEQGYERLAQSMVRAAQEIPRLFQLQNRLTGGGTSERNFAFDQERLANQQVEEFERIGLMGLGLDQQGRRAIDRVMNEAIIGVVDGLSAAQVGRNPRLREAAYNATEGQIRELRAQIQDDVARVRLIQLERQRIITDTTRVGALRGRQEQEVLQGRQRDDVTLTREDRLALSQIGRLSDVALVRVTEGLSPRELGADLFQLRNEALRREAQRQVEQESDARAAMEEGLKTQKNIEGLLREIRNGVLSGDMGLAVRVTNETQARIDANALKETANGLRVNAGSSSNVNPYASAFGRYGRGGSN